MFKKTTTSFIKQKELAIQYDVSEGMISDISKEKDRWLAIDLNSLQAGSKCEKKVAFPVIKEALTIWVNNAMQNGLIITDNILLTKALGFAFLLKKDKFKGSSRWIDNFKKWHNLKLYSVHGEVASAPLEDLYAMLDKFREILKDYDPENIFNCDETGLFWKMKPRHTISNGPVSGTKQLKDCVTVLLTCNLSGTEKLCLYMKPKLKAKSRNISVLEA